MHLTQHLPNTWHVWSPSSVQFNRSVVSNSLRPHGLQHARLPCPSLSPGACLNSCPLSQWCHPTISSSVIPFSCAWKGKVEVKSLICFAYKLNKQGDNIQPWHTPFPIWNQSCFMYGFNYCFLTCIQISQEPGKVVWYSHLFKNFPQFVVIHTVKGFSVVNEAERDVFFWNFLTFSII